MTDRQPGTIILLNGSASSGKTSIANAIKRLAEEPYLHLGIDVFWERVFPHEWVGASQNTWNHVPVEGSDPPKSAVVFTPFGLSFTSGLHHTVAALSRIGHNVVVDHVLTDALQVRSCVETWRGLPVLSVGVRCPLHATLGRASTRVAERWPEYIEAVAWQHGEVHMHTRALYDLEVDTSCLGPDECAQTILGYLREHRARDGFERLATEVLDKR
ncbi:MAG: hypothetical protein M3464_03050 [Chloroflexota bacterium]|nr:hypothetical protein [Chloroflexota bacterium]